MLSQHAFHKIKAFYTTKKERIINWHEQAKTET